MVLGLREAVLECTILDAKQAVEDRLADYLHDLTFYELGRNEVRSIKSRCEELQWILRLLDEAPV